jgi:hypothetical protein
MPKRIVDVAPVPLERDPANPDPNAFSAMNGRWIIRRVVMQVADRGVRPGDTVWICYDRTGEHGRGYPWTFNTVDAVLRHIPRTHRFAAQARHPRRRAA